MYPEENQLARISRDENSAMTRNQMPEEAKMSTKKNTKNTNAKNTNAKGTDKKAAQKKATPPANTDEPKTDKPERKLAPKPTWSRVTQTAKVEGVGDIEVTLVCCEYNGEKKAAPTRKDCAEWLKAKRAAYAEKHKEEREAAKLQRELERAQKRGPVITKRLETMEKRLGALAGMPTITKDQSVKLAQAAELIKSVLAERAESDKEEVTK